MSSSDTDSTSNGNCFNSSDNVSRIVEHIFDTELLKNRLVIRWTIHSFSLLHKNKDVKSSSFYLFSPKFEMNRINTAKNYKMAFCVCLGPYQKYHNKSKDYDISLGLTCENNEWQSQDYKPEVKWYFAIITSENRETRKSDYAYVYDRNCTVGPENYVRKNFLFGRRQHLLPNDNLTIICSIDANLHYKSVQREIFSISRTVAPLLDHKHFFEKLIEDEKFCDVIFICGNEELKAHKLILATYSPVFWEMFEKDTQDRNKKIVINDVSFKAMKEMKNFMYTGETKNMKDLAYDLMGLANKYAIPCLKTICEQYYCSYLSKDNALKMLILAEEFNAKDLKEKAIDVIILNQKEIVDTNNLQFEELKASNPALIAEIYTSLITKYNFSASLK